MPWRRPRNSAAGFLKIWAMTCPCTSACHPDFKLRDKPNTPPETLHRARAVAMEMGLKFVYEGNIYSDGGNTICPGCKRTLVKRWWHQVSDVRITEEGECQYCGAQIP